VVIAAGAAVKLMLIIFVENHLATGWAFNPEIIWYVI
jgi:hypothetical protein